MLSTFLYNGKIIFIVALIFIFFNEINKKVVWRIKWNLENALKKFEMLNNVYIKSVIKFIISYSIITCLVSLQEKYKFININLYQNNSTLAISVLTMYGIFYAFIQFLIGYTLQNDNDKCWGISKTKFLVEHNIEFEFFNSILFKVLLIISSIVPFLKIDTVKFISTYKNFIDNLWVVSVFSVYFLYVLLFIKSLIIMSQLFGREEKGENFLEYDIKNKIKKEYNIYFRRGYKYKNYRFTEILFEKIKNLNEIEKFEMVREIIFYVMSDYESTQLHCFNKIKDDKKIRKSKKLKTKYMNESEKMKSYIYCIFENLWGYIQKEKNNINFKDILNIYELKYKILFNEMKIYCLNNGKKVIEQIYQANKYINNISENLSCFQIPEIIWNKVSNYKELIELNSSISRMFMREKYLDINESLYNNRWLEEYEKYVELILEKYKEFYNTKQKDSLENIFGIYTWNPSEEKIGDETQNIIFQYIINLKYDYHNKQYIRFLLKELDYKYTIIFIFYMMLYADNSFKLEWKKDIVSLKTICSNIYSYVDGDLQSNSEVICELIEENTKGHISKVNLIKWIIKNIDSGITEDIINKCNENKYMTYAKFLKFKYIFLENNNYYFNFDNINLDNINKDNREDWRLNFLKEMITTPKLLKERFFYKHQHRFYEKFLSEDLLEYRYEIGDFRIFYINVDLKICEEQAIHMIEEDRLLVQSICEFLILKIDEEEYSYLVSNDEIAKIFSKAIRNILDNKNSKVENYIDDLIDRANECSSNRQIYINKKDRIIRKIGNLIITK
ncbi:hypothetical protein CBB2_1772 [Clostridium botulinum]|uniref:hypothetical protein n=1 Tax=Clostridium botulinum TaxID=1491 RepID=UPI000581D5B9|nr:hypothetical protein [Clostridium botulinum]BAQ13882.1 hypothetical protein CBB2_1772 [Clostridium botulinum]